MRWHSAAFSILALLPALGRAQTVQLPSFHSFSVETTVSVPDSGGASLAGSNRTRSGRGQLNGVLPGGGAALGGERVAVTAKIHDFAANEDRMMNQPVAAGAQAKGPLAKLALPAKRPAEDAAASIADIGARRMAQQSERQDEARRWFERGRRAATDGKISVARTYFQMAARQATGRLKEQSLAEINALAGQSPRRTF